MTTETLKTGILGLNSDGLGLVEAVADCSFLDLKAVADKDLRKNQIIEKKFGCAIYDDYRQFILQNDFDCLIVTSSHDGFDEYIKMALKKKFNILKIAPPAVNFEQASEYVKIASDNDVTFHVANPNRFSSSFKKLAEIFKSKQRKKTLFFECRISVNPKPAEKWQTDLKLAGGGVLLYNSYNAIDTLVKCFNLPDQVYAITTNKAVDRKQKSFLAEDTAVLSLKYGNSLIGSLTSIVNNQPESTFIKIRTTENIFEFSKDHIITKDSDFNIIDETAFDDDPESLFSTMLNNFAHTLLDPEIYKLPCTSEETLKNMALIESAYLSARTAMPEDPKKIMQIEKKDPGFLW